LDKTNDLSTGSTPAGLQDWASLLRPWQWVKNVVVFAGPAAGLKLGSLTASLQALGAFAVFCLTASGTYAINDVLDRRADARHPTKRNRPVARGAIQPAVAVVLGSVLVLAALVASVVLLNRSVTVVLLFYFSITLAYSAYLKDRVILDVIIVALGFVLRAWAGSLAVGVETSAWLVACVFTLCLFMGFGKRRCELSMIDDRNDAGLHRRTLLRYTPDLLNHLITVSAGIAVITFLLYTMDTGGHPAPFNKEHLFYTLPLVVYGIFRFAMVTESGVHSGPTEIVLRDRPLLGTIILWTGLALLIAYQNALLGPAGLEGLLASW
jgi:4-hydroxybenzoate polyprenyltransferase